MSTETEVLDIEHRIICRLLTEPDDWAAVANARINSEFFQNAKHRRVWKNIVEYQAQYRAVPTLQVLRRDFPKETYRFLKVEEPIDFLIDELRRNRQAALLEQGIADAATAWEQGAYDEAQRALDAASAALYRAIPVVDDADLTKTGDERLAAYLERQAAGADGGLIGVSTGFASLDRATGGLQPEQLITITGFAKNGKSFLLMDVARAIHLSGEVPLFVGFEMSNVEQGERFDSARAGVSLSRLRNGTLAPEEWELLERSIASLSNMHSFILSADRSSTMTLSGIDAKIDQLRPTAVIVDGAYMMEDENGEAKGSSQALTNITRGFKRLAQKHKIPIIISTQSLEWKADRKKGLTRSSIGYSSSFIQDSDVVIGVETSQDDPAIQVVKVMAARNCPPMDFYIRRDWDKGFVEELDYNPFETDGGDENDDYGLAY